MEAKMSELTIRLSSNQGLIADAADTASLQTLQAAQEELNDTRETLGMYQEMFHEKAEEVVLFYASADFLQSETSFLEYHDFRWPTQVSCASFYLFAVMLVPLSAWADSSALRTGSCIRHMALRLSEYIREETTRVEEDERAIVEGIHTTFNACCDIVSQEEKKATLMSAMGRQAWRDEQERMWEAAKAKFNERITFNSHAPISQIKVLDDLADIWRHRNSAQHNNHTAVEKAQEAAQCA